MKTWPQLLVGKWWQNPATLFNISIKNCWSSPQVGMQHHDYDHTFSFPTKWKTTQSHPKRTYGFLSGGLGTSKSCDNYPCCSPMVHLHNHHQPFTEDTQRLIMRQQRDKEHFRTPLRTRSARGVIVGWFYTQNDTKPNKRDAVIIRQSGWKWEKCF